MVIAGPFGLFGFGLATVLLNLANVGVFPIAPMNFAMGLASGCLLQGVGAIIAITQGQLISGVAFFSYAFFWFSFILNSMMVPKDMPPSSTLAMGFYLMAWLAFSCVMTVCIWRPKSTWAIRIVFLTVDVLFFLLALTDFVKAGGHKEAADVIHKIAGADGLICGLSAFYTGAAEIINVVYNRSVLPLGEIEAPTVRALGNVTAVKTDDGQPAQSASSLRKGETSEEHETAFGEPSPMVPVDYPRRRVRRNTQTYSSFGEMQEHVFFK